LGRVERALADVSDSLVCTARARLAKGFYFPSKRFHPTFNAKLWPLPVWDTRCNPTLSFFSLTLPELDHRSVHHKLTFRNHSMVAMRLIAKVVDAEVDRTAVRWAVLA